MGSWISPTSHDTDWANPTYAYNGDTGDYAGKAVFNKSWSTNIDLFFSAVDSTKVRIYSGRDATDVDTIRVHVQKDSDSTWVEIYNGSLTVGQYVEYTIGETLKIKGVRAALYNKHPAQIRNARQHDTEIWQESAQVEGAALYY